MSCKLEPAIWSRDIGHIGIHARGGRTYRRTYGRTVTKMDGFMGFLPMVVRVRTFGPPSSAISDTFYEPADCWCNNGR